MSRHTSGVGRERLKKIESGNMENFYSLEMLTSIYSYFLEKMALKIIQINFPDEQGPTDAFNKFVDQLNANTKKMNEKIEFSTLCKSDYIFSRNEEWLRNIIASVNKPQNKLIKKKRDKKIHKLYGHMD
jgi:GTPase involved in cell partitioning and DNA repair